MMYFYKKTEPNSPLVFWVQNSIINVTASILGGGNAYITAEARRSDKETNGFVFKYCSIIGTGPAFLGRAYGDCRDTICNDP